jgi:hypothetical protein
VLGWRIDDPGEHLHQHLRQHPVGGAASTDPYFAHPRDPGNKPATDVLRAAIRSTA